VNSVCSRGPSRPLSQRCPINSKHLTPEQIVSMAIGAPTAERYSINSIPNLQQKLLRSRLPNHTTNRVASGGMID
jgi:hypothetical protein